MIQFVIGIRDSLSIKESFIRYLFPQDQQNITFRNAFKQIFSGNCEETFQTVRENFKNIFLRGIYFLAIVLALGICRPRLESFIGFYIPAIIYWILLSVIYLAFFLQIWIWMQEIGEECVKIEIEHYDNKKFLEYQIEIEKISTLSLFHKTLTRILFNLLFQIQSNLLTMIVPFSILKILIYSIFISVTHISAKIPYKDHLPYYLNQNIFYLLGLNCIQSTLLHLSRFPIFTGFQWIFLSFFLMNSISREPPRIIRQPQNLKQLMVSVYKILLGKEDEIVEYQRDSYKEHLKSFIRDEEYKRRCLQNVSYLSIPARLTPYAQKLIDKLISLIED